MTEEEFCKLRDDVHILLRRSTSTSTRVWELAMKAAVPLCFILAAALIRNEVVHTEHTVRIQSNERAIEKLPPSWLKERINEIQRSQAELGARFEAAMDGVQQRLTALETKVNNR